VDTLENKYPVHFVFIRAPWVMTDWTSNLMKIGVAPKRNLIRELITITV
jgi:hypothetical protein